MLIRLIREVCQLGFDILTYIDAEVSKLNKNSFTQQIGGRLPLERRGPGIIADRDRPEVLEVKHQLVRGLNKDLKSLDASVALIYPIINAVLWHLPIFFRRAVKYIRWRRLGWQPQRADTDVSDRSKL
jgi:hypothetical protein